MYLKALQQQMANDDSEVLATAKQVQALQILFRRYTDNRSDRLTWTSMIVGHPLATFNELTIGEAGILLDFAYPNGIRAGYDSRFTLLIEEVQQECYYEPF